MRRRRTGKKTSPRRCAGFQAETQKERAQSTPANSVLCLECHLPRMPSHQSRCSYGSMRLLQQKSSRPNAPARPLKPQSTQMPKQRVAAALDQRSMSHRSTRRRAGVHCRRETLRALQAYARAPTQYTLFLASEAGGGRRGGSWPLEAPHWLTRPLTPAPGTAVVCPRQLAAPSWHMRHWTLGLSSGGVRPRSRDPISCSGSRSPLQSRCRSICCG